MHLPKKVIAYVLAIFTLSATYVGAADYDISEFNINNISLPKSFSTCSRDEYDSKFLNLLNANGYTFSEWTQDVMIPDNLYICGRDNKGNAIHVSVSDPSSEKDKEENIKFHRLMYDYNLYITSSRAKEKVLIKYRDSLVEKGVNKRKIKRIKWFEKDEISAYTPYIMGIYENSDGAFVCDFSTIYDGNFISIYLISKDEPDSDDESFMGEIIKDIDFNNDIDYSQAKQVYRQNQRVKLPERLSSKQKKSKVLVGLALCFISVVILSAITITTAKIRRRTKSSRNSKFGRY